MGLYTGQKINQAVNINKSLLNCAFFVTVLACLFIPVGGITMVLSGAAQMLYPRILKGGVFKDRQGSNPELTSVILRLFS